MKVPVHLINKPLQFLLYVTFFSFTMLMLTSDLSAEKKRKGNKKKNVAVQTTEKKAKGNKKTNSSKPEEKPGLIAVDFDKKATTINADKLTLRAKVREFTYNDKVVVIQDDLTINCNQLDGTYTEKNEIQKLVATGEVEILKGENIKAYGNRAVYLAKTETIELTESPRVEQDGSTLSADKVLIFVNEDRSEAIGNVRVSMIENKTTQPGAKAGKSGNPLAR